MKVIVAGYSKTGTKSMSTALKQLGYTVYDYLEHYTEHGDDWVRIFNEGGTTEDFKIMYENVDAVTDVPADLFWDEIFRAFPDAKIILTVRDCEEKWFQSIKNHTEMYYSSWKVKMLLFSPTYWKFKHFFDSYGSFRDGYSIATDIFPSYNINELLMRMKYRRHNANVLQNAPKDKLLMFNVKQGWKPLCEFLEVEVPNTPFPHSNIRGEYINHLFDDVVFQKMHCESRVVGCLIFLTLTFGGYQLAKYGVNKFYISNVTQVTTFNVFFCYFECTSI